MTPFDKKWLMVSELTGGYIRVTSNKKSAIKQVFPDARLWGMVKVPPRRLFP